MTNKSLETPKRKTQSDDKSCINKASKVLNK